MESTATQPAKPKPPNAGKGRKAGVPNKATKDARTMFAAFLDKKSEQVEELWDRVALKDPKGAIELLTKVGEFVIPKLARTEHSGPLGGPIATVSAIQTLSDDDAMKSYLKMLKGDSPT